MAHVRISNLAPDVTKEDIEKIFELVGKFSDLRLLGGGGARHAFLMYGTAACAAQAVTSLHGLRLGGQAITVERSGPPPTAALAKAADAENDALAKAIATAKAAAERTSQGGETQARRAAQAPPAAAADPLAGLMAMASGAPAASAAGMPQLGAFAAGGLEAAAGGDWSAGGSTDMMAMAQLYAAYAQQLQAMAPSMPPLMAPVPPQGQDPQAGDWAAAVPTTGQLFREGSVGSGSRAAPASSNGRLWVGDLPTHVTKDDLLAVFGSYGQVTEVAIVAGREKILGRSYAIVKFNDPNAANTASDALNGKYEFQAGDGPIIVRPKTDNPKRSGPY